MIGFTQRKFQSFSQEKQHKKCVELLSIIYRGGPIEQYREIEQWLELSPIELDPKSISDRFHWHLNKANLSLQEHNLLPMVRAGDREKALRATLPISIYLDNIRSAHNVGSIIRTTEAFNLGSITCSENTPYINHKQVQDTAMGAHEWVKCQKGTLDSLPHPIIAIETVEGATSMYNFQFPESFTLVLGNEEYGCSDKTLEIADIILEIPMRGRKNSLNVANAYAVIASEICRQKQIGESDDQSK